MISATNVSTRNAYLVVQR